MKLPLKSGFTPESCRGLALLNPYLRPNLDGYSYNPSLGVVVITTTIVLMVF